MTTNPIVPDDMPSDAELAEQHLDAVNRQLRERLAMRNAAAALFHTHLERLLEAIEAGDVTPRVLAGARKALGWSYSEDDLGDYGERSF